MIAVGDERRGVEAPAGTEANHGSQLVAREADGAGDPEREQVLEILWIHEPIDGLNRGDARTEEDRADDAVAGDCARRAQSAMRRRRRGGPR